MLSLLSPINTETSLGILKPLLDTKSAQLSPAEVPSRSQS
jgi:hypothetical protein